MNKSKSKLTFFEKILLVSANDAVCFLAIILLVSTFFFVLNILSYFIVMIIISLTRYYLPSLAISTFEVTLTQIIYMSSHIGKKLLLFNIRSFFRVRTSKFYFNFVKKYLLAFICLLKLYNNT